MEQGFAVQFLLYLNSGEQKRSSICWFISKMPTMARPKTNLWDSTQVTMGVAGSPLLQPSSIASWDACGGKLASEAPPGPEPSHSEVGYEQLQGHLGCAKCRPLLFCYVYKVIVIKTSLC